MKAVRDREGGHRKGRLNIRYPWIKGPMHTEVIHIMPTPEKVGIKIKMAFNTSLLSLKKPCGRREVTTLRDGVSMSQGWWSSQIPG